MKQREKFEGKIKITIKMNKRRRISRIGLPGGWREVV